MRSLTIQIISVCGRYSVLILLPPVALAVWGWLFLFEDYTWLPIVLGIPLLLIVLSTMVLVLGMLVAGIRRPVGIVVDRVAAPDLWAYWDTASPKGATVRRQIIVDAEINAAIAETSLYAGLFGRDQTLMLGVGLLIVLDRPAIEAVLEHEFAHAELKHTSGLTRIGEFLMTYYSFEDYIGDDMPGVDLFLDAVFTWFTEWLEKEYRRKSRVHELQADRQSADRVGMDAEARAQILHEGSAHIAKTIIYEPLERELRGAVVAPAPPPLDRLLEKRADLTDLGNIRRAIEEVLLEEPEPDATHPPLAERLAAVGATPDMAVTPVGPPAFQTLLPEETQERLLRELNEQWTKAADDYVRLE